MTQTMLLELTDMVVRSWGRVVAGICLGLATAVVALHYAPKTYEAGAKVFVAPQQIPPDLVRSTVTDDTKLRMATLEDAALSRPYLVKLIERTFGLPADEAALEQLVREIRSRFRVDVSLGQFELMYGDSDPERAAQVVNALADIYIDETSRIRAERAAEITRTLQDLAHRLLTDLNVKEREIAEFKAAHLYETAQREEANLRILEGRYRDLEANRKAQESGLDRLTSLRAQQTQALRNPGQIPADASRDPSVTRQFVLQTELESLKARYSEEHPQVQAKKREIEELLDSTRAEAPRAGGEAGSPPHPPASPAAPYQAEIQSLEGEVRTLGAEEQRIRQDIAIYERRIEATPGAEQRLAELTKGYDVLLTQFREYQSKVESAKNWQKIEETRKGEQFQVIERALPPSRPARPVPLVVYFLGLTLGLAAFVGPLVVSSLLNPLVYSESGIRAFTDVPVLVSIPEIPVPAVLVADRQRRNRNLGLSALSAIVLTVVSFLID